MAVVSRGVKRNITKCVPINDLLSYGFSTFDISNAAGVSAADVTALGQKDLAGAVGTIVFGCSAPRAARFTKKLESGTRGSVSSYGDGTSSAAITTARAAGWKQTRRVSRTTLGATAKSQSVGIKLPSGLIYVQAIPKADFTAYGATLGLIEPASLTDAERKKAIRGGRKCSEKPLRVWKAVNGSTVTLPVSFSEYQDALDDGWNDVLD